MTANAGAGSGGGPQNSDAAPPVSLPDISDNPGVSVVIGPAGLEVRGKDGGNSVFKVRRDGLSPYSLEVTGEPGSNDQLKLGQNTGSGVAIFGELGPNGIGQFGGGGVTGSFDDVQLCIISDINTSYWVVPTGGGGVTFTGLDSAYNSGHILKYGTPRRIIFNNGVGNLTIQHEGMASVDHNRANFVGAADLVIPPLGCAVLQKIPALGAGTANRWLLESKNF